MTDKSSHSLTRRRTDTVATRCATFRHFTTTSSLLLLQTMFVANTCHCACVWTGLQMVRHVYHTTIVLLWSPCISRFIHGKNKGKTPLRMRVTGLQMLGHVYHTTIVPRLLSCISRFVQCKKTRTKRHCACVWMGLQMVGHIYHTTIAPRLLSCISRFVQCKNKDKTPLRMRVDGFADGVTRISHHNRAKTAIMYITLRSMQKQGQNAIAHACGWVCRWWDTYITPQSCQDCYRVYHASFNAKTSKTPLRMRVDGFADGGTHISHHNRAKTAIVYITLRSMQKQGQNAIAHACGWVCRWWDTYITPQSCQDCYHVYHASFNAKTRAKRHCACVWMGLQMVGHVYHTTIVLCLACLVFVAFPRKPLFVCLTFREHS